MNKLSEPEIIEYIKGHLHDDPFSLSLQAKKSGIAHIDEAILQIQARQKAMKKLPSFSQNFDLIFPHPVSIEQASSEITARFKSQLFSGKTFADLTGGMGMDSLYFSGQFESLAYVDQSEELCEIAHHNFKVLNRERINVVQTTAEQYLSEMKPCDLIYLDPSRRSEAQKKVFRVEDCLPNIIDLQNELVNKGKNVLIKLSPLADIKDAFQKLQFLQKVWVVAVKNECKELLFWLTDKERDDMLIEAVNLNDDKEEIFSFSLDDESELEPNVAPLSDYLYEPNAAIMKSGAFKSIAQKFNVKKLHKNSHLYTSNQQMEFPGRVFRVIGRMKADKKVIKRLVGNQKVNVITRNFHLKPEEILKKYKLKSGGEQFLIATTLLDESRVLLLCDRVK